MISSKHSFYRYLPISGTDRDWGCYITGAGQATIAAGAPYPPPGHPTAYEFTWERGRILQEYQILYLTRGQGLFESEPTGIVKLKAGDAFLIFPGVWHRYQPLEQTGWDEYWVALSGDHLDRMAQRKFISPQRPVFSIGSDDKLLNYYVNLFGVLQQESIGFQPVIASWAMLILSTILARSKATGVDGRVESLVRKAKCVMLERMEGALDMKELARELHLSYVYFRHIFKYYTGISPHQYYLLLRIERAKELLNATPMSVKDISASLGFENQNYFSRLFKKKVDLSPEHWRELSQRPTPALP